MSLPRYGEYKESKVDWLGSVPAHWRLSRLQDVADVVNGYPFDSKLFADDGKHSLIRIRDLDATETVTRYNGEFVAAAAVSSGEVLIGMDGDFNVGRWLGSHPALLNQRMCCVRAESAAMTNFLRYALPIPLKAINDVTYSTTVKHLSSLDVEKIRFAIPEGGELVTLVTFLDRETAKIDALISEQEELIALLAEKRQATISHAVTKGLDPHAPMKDSGVAWLRVVPAHWPIVKLGRYATIGNGTTPSRDVPEYWDDGKIPWLASGEVNQFKITRAFEFVTSAALDKCSLNLLPVGTVVVGLVGQGKTRGMAAILKIPATINQNLAAVCSGEKLDSIFVLYVFQAMYEWLREAGRGGNQAAMNCEMLSALRVPLPALSEQGDIVRFISEELAKLESLGAEAGRAIALLKERRSALIAAAVTGQIDVRGAVAAQEPA